MVVTKKEEKNSSFAGLATLQLICKLFNAKPFIENRNLKITYVLFMDQEEHFFFFINSKMLYRINLQITSSAQNKEGLKYSWQYQLS